MKWIPERLAIYGTLTILALTVLFHLLVLAGVVPYEMVWGGRLTSVDEMRQFETISILLNLLMAVVVAIRADLLRLPIHRMVPRGILWAMAVLFALNTVGNIASLNTMEAIIFTPVTLVLCVFSVKLALPRG